MIKNRMRKIYITFAAMVMAGMMTACSVSGEAVGSSSVESVKTETQAEAEKETQVTDKSKEKSETEVDDNSDSKADASEDNKSSGTEAVKADSDIFTDRDLEQTADTAGAEKIALSSGQNVSITKEGVYLVSGNATDVTISIEAGDEDKVQIVLDGVTVKNSSAPFIYVKSADKVFVTTTESENTVEVSGSFEADGDTNLDAAIFSKDDLVINGLGTLNITSSDNGVACKDTLKITGSTINVKCSGNAFEAHDAIEIADGVVNRRNLYRGRYI